ncbi:hypothetical protein AVEN_118328-1 [Araneus ventricosus]|uniref:Uncharacterized protein n=1 Tax=Araneus ventricosus TaxID=182803 RepID=A0A4Y2B7Q6_ARAVE|nr:hypothetical protein AVEN_118328-1 [Araneus ventricosus]
MSPLTLKKSRASKGSVSKVSLDRRRQERMCSGDALATPHFAHTGKTLLPWLKEQLLRLSPVYLEGRGDLVRANRPPAAVVRKLGEGGGQLRCRPRHLTDVQNDEVHPKIALVLLQNGTLIYNLHIKFPKYKGCIFQTISAIRSPRSLTDKTSIF